MQILAVYAEVFMVKTNFFSGQIRSFPKSLETGSPVYKLQVLCSGDKNVFISIFPAVFHYIMPPSKTKVSGLELPLDKIVNFKLSNCDCFVVMKCLTSKQ